MGTEASGTRRRVLFITHEPFGADLRGGAIRAYELARAVAGRAEVTLAAPAGDGEAPDDVRHVAFDAATFEGLRPLVEEAEVVVAPPVAPTVAGWLRRSGARLIVDLDEAAPFPAYERARERSGPARHVTPLVALDNALEALHLGHRFVCASGRQRDLWLGAMLAARLVSPAAYAADPTLRDVIDEVPFGAPDELPGLSMFNPYFERFPEIGGGVEIVLWNGGNWNRLDPETAVRAVAKLVKGRPQARLVFMGRAPVQAADDVAGSNARRVAERLGLLDKVVFFNDGWIPYADRSAWLLDAHCAVSTHVERLETRFASRPRLLDCLWTRLPVVCTGGDEVAGRIARDDLGAVVAPRDVAGVATGLERVLERGRESYAEAMERAWEDHRWSAVAKPLIRYVCDERPSAPLGAPWPRRLSRPVQRGRGLGIRAARRAVDAARSARDRAG